MSASSCGRVRRSCRRGHGASVTELFDNSRFGVIQLDRRGRIVEANDRARDLLRCGDGLFDRQGLLSVWLPAEDADLQ